MSFSILWMFNATEDWRWRAEQVNKAKKATIRASEEGRRSWAAPVSLIQDLKADETENVRSSQQNTVNNSCAAGMYADCRWLISCNHSVTVSCSLQAWHQKAATWIICAPAITLKFVQGFRGLHPYHPYSLSHHCPLRILPPSTPIDVNQNCITLNSVIWTIYWKEVVFFLLNYVLHKSINT